jgi:hypothetical protein
MWISLHRGSRSVYTGSLICEHLFVSATGSPYARFQRALASRNPTIAWAAATELPDIDLADALELCLLIAPDPSRYPRAAARWHARYCAELRGVTLTESQLVLAALAALPEGVGAAAAAAALAHLAEQRGLERVAQVLDRWAR